MSADGEGLAAALKNALRNIAALDAQAGHDNAGDMRARHTPIHRVWLMQPAGGDIPLTPRPSRATVTAAPSHGRGT